MKVCSKCGVEKELIEFSKNKSRKDGVSSYCKKCHKEYIKEYAKEYRKNNKEYIKEYRKTNKEKISKQNKEYRKTNKDKIKECIGNNKDKIKEYRENNKDKRKEYYQNNKEYLKEYLKEYYQNNKDKRKEYIKNKRKIDPLFKMTRNLRTRTCMAFKAKKWNKNGTQKMLGCDFETAHAHLERQFIKGMSWENHGEWHIDHIIPLASAQTEEELIKLCHYTNLQPLWAIDNLIKGSTMPNVQIQLRI